MATFRESCMVNHRSWSRALLMAAGNPFKQECFPIASVVFTLINVSHDHRVVR